MNLLINELQRLTAPGVISDFTHFEVTQVFGHTPNTSDYWNVFTLIVGQEGPNALRPAYKPEYLSPELLRIRSLQNWRIGLHRYALTAIDLAAVITAYSAGAGWAPNGHPIAVGRLEPVVGRFAPADGSFPQPWNAVLKNNFWGGSHLLELADADKPHVAPLLEHPAALQELSEAIRPFLPLGIARASDRLGNVVIQLPVQAVVARLALQRAAGTGTVTLDWHPQITPRPLRFVCDRQYDGMNTGTWSAIVHEGTTTFPVTEARGLYTGMLWDDGHDVLLWSQAPVGSVSQIVPTMHVQHPERRRFWTGTGPDRAQREVTLTATTTRLRSAALRAWRSTNGAGGGSTITSVPP